MARTKDRLRRYLADELGECCDEAVERRLDELSTLESALGETRVAAGLGVLSALVDAGLVEGRKDGRWEMYRAVALVTVLEGSIDRE